MLQFLIGLSILAFVLAAIYGSERIIFRRQPKDAANHVANSTLCCDLTGGALAEPVAALLLIFLALLLIVSIVIVCIYAFRRMAFGRASAPRLLPADRRQPRSK